MPLTESSITLNFPDNNYFRLCDCDGYKRIQNNLSEMDVCWFDATNNILYLIELKDWKNNILIEEADSEISSEKISEMKKGISKHRIKILVKKSIDSTCMFLSAFLNKPSGKRIMACAPFTISNTTRIMLLSIINWTDTDLSYIATIHSEYQSKFVPYARLFEINTYLVLTKEQAKKHFAWIT